ncbi:hypothetical protein BJP24_14460 [Aeromonas allosaccharophila]|nr:hypothetical protein BJP24_14460 [Aeromonas allosaccharophila]
MVDILKIERQCPHVWGLISSCDIKLGLYEMAVKSADTAIRLKPAYSLFHMTKCMALEGLGLYSEAYEEVKISCMLNPRHKMYFEVLNKLARLSSRETVELAPLIQQKKDTAFLNKINALFDNSQALNFDLSLFN